MPFLAPSDLGVRQALLAVGLQQPSHIAGIDLVQRFIHFAC
jgi:hypothetical protein